MFSKIFTLLVPFFLYNNWPYGYIVVFFYIEESINTTLQRFVDFLTCNIFYDFLKLYHEYLFNLSCLRNWPIVVLVCFVFCLVTLRRFN